MSEGDDEPETKQINNEIQSFVFRDKKTKQQKIFINKFLRNLFANMMKSEQ